MSASATSAVPEGQTGDTTYASIAVTLSAPSGVAASVDWSTADGTATAGSDYTASSGTVSFAPGETTQAVLVPVIGDNASEGDETFDVNLSSPVEATIGNATNVVTIVDNDPIPPGSAVLSVTGAKVLEGRSGTKVLSLTVTRGGETTTAVNVDYATSDGTALAPTDYVAAAGTLAFTANQTSATVDVTVNGDGRLEHDETFFLSLLNPSAGAADPDGAGDRHDRERRHEDGGRRQGSCREAPGRRARTCLTRAPGQACGCAALSSPVRLVGPARHEASAPGRNH